MSDPIIDDYTDLPISRQRKWQLRHKEQHAVYKERYDKSEKGKATAKRWRMEKK